MNRGKSDQIETLEGTENSVEEIPDLWKILYSSYNWREKNKSSKVETYVQKNIKL